MSLLSSLASVRLAKLLTAGAIAFALASQGCAASTVTRSSSIEPVMNAAGTVAGGRADSPASKEHAQPSERHVAEHTSALTRDRHGVRSDFCRRCSAN